MATTAPGRSAPILHSPAAGIVVNASGRVHGTERLSIVDASIMPDVPPGFVHFPVIMLAERLSERIAN